MRRVLLGLAAAILAAGACLAQGAGHFVDPAHGVPAPTGEGTSATTFGAIAIVSPSALERGANSFTEAQARAQLQDAGLASLSDLRRGPDGIWRGRGARGGKPVNVGLDYRGVIAAQ